MARREKEIEPLEITNIEFYEHDSGRKSDFIGYASITLNDQFVITGLRVYESSKGNWVGMPGNEVGRGRKAEWKDICYPLNKEFRDEIAEAVLDEVGLDYEPYRKGGGRNSKRSSGKRSRYNDEDDHGSRRSNKRSRYDDDDDDDADDDDRGSSRKRKKRSSRYD